MKWTRNKDTTVRFFVSARLPARPPAKGIATVSRRTVPRRTTAANRRFGSENPSCANTPRRRASTKETKMPAQPTASRTPKIELFMCREKPPGELKNIKPLFRLPALGSQLSTLMRGLVLAAVAARASAAGFPEPVSGDFRIANFRFASGETLPELSIHYRTIGTPRRDEKGVVRNAILLLHGTTGSGRQFLTPNFGGTLFGEGQLLDASKYYLVIPDGIGHGDSSRPSQGLHARFPRYGYDD